MNSDNTNPFGKQHLRLAALLYKAGRHHENLFNLYISARSGCDAWDFYEADIRKHTGLNYRTVKKLCAMYVYAGIFTIDGTGSRGSSMYQLDKGKFAAYLSGDKLLTLPDSTWIAPYVQSSNIVSSIQSSLHQGYNDDDCTYDTTNIAPRIQTISNSKNEEVRNQNRKEEAKPLPTCPDLKHSPDSLMKAERFIKLVTALANSDPELNIMTPAKSLQMADSYFAANPTATPESLLEDFTNIINECSLIKCIVSVPKGFDHWYNLRRANDLSYYLKPTAREKIQYELQSREEV